MLVIIAWVARIRASHVDEENQERTPLNMPQEPVTETAIFVGALDETRHVGEQEAFRALHFVGIVDHPDLRMQRGERIRRRLGPRLGDARGQRRFTRVGETHEPHIGDALQDQPILTALPVEARISPLRRTMR